MAKKRYDRVQKTRKVEHKPPAATETAELETVTKKSKKKRQAATETAELGAVPKKQKLQAATDDDAESDDADDDDFAAAIFGNAAVRAVAPAKDALQEAVAKKKKKSHAAEAAPKQKQISQADVEVEPAADSQPEVVQKTKKTKTPDGDAVEVDEAAGVRKAVVKKKKKKKDQHDSEKVAATAPQEAAPKQKQTSQEDVDVEPAADSQAEVVQKTKTTKTLDGDADDIAVQESDGNSAPSQGAPFKVCIGGLAWEIKEAMLRTDFGDCGEVTELTHLADRGLAFVTFATEAGLLAALKYDGEDYDGRTLKVSRAIERKGLGKGKDKGKGNGKAKGKAAPPPKPSDKPEHCTSVLLKSLSDDAEEFDVYEFFRQCGQGATNVKIIAAGANAVGKRLAFVDFDDTDAVDDAAKLHGQDLKGRPAKVAYSKPRAHKIAKTPWT